VRGRALAGEAEEVATVAGLTHEGEGVVHAGKTVFVAGALPDEQIRFRRIRRHRQHDEGRLLEVLAPSPERIVPRCPHFGVCGGCALQHLAPAAQIAAKERQLRDNLGRLGKVMPRVWLAPLVGPPWGYRRRARLGAKYVAKKGRVVVGFRERLAPYVEAAEQCAVLTPPVGDLLPPLSAMLTLLTIRERVPQIEVAVADNAVALVLRVLEPPTQEDLERLTGFAQSYGVRVYLQPGGLDTVRELTGPGEPLRYRLPAFNVELGFAPTDFVQVNGPVNEALVTRAVELLAPTQESAVLDLFCGIGNFSLPLARRTARVTGVEGEAGLVARARGNAASNGLKNAEFDVGDLAQLRPATWMQQSYSHVLLDPPRAGAKEVLGLIAQLKPARLVYISCHPGSLARDLGILVHEHGYNLEAAGVVDMFPHTAHVESIALLRPGGGHPA
jgi:23S rRNA (uracil1939-C5)-methyltransferase